MNPGLVAPILSAVLAALGPPGEKGTPAGRHRMSNPAYRTIGRLRAPDAGHWTLEIAGDGRGASTFVFRRSSFHILPGASAPDEAGSAERYRRLAGPLVLTAAFGILLVGLAMIAWVVHWGRHLRRRTPPHRDRSRLPRPDPWVIAGRRMKTPDEPDQPEERT